MIFRVEGEAKAAAYHVLGDLWTGLEASSTLTLAQVFLATSASSVQALHGHVRIKPP